jgi:hypothetical protein
VAVVTAARRRYCPRCRTWHAADAFDAHLCQTPEDGHTFRLEVHVRGSYGLVGLTGRTDSDWMGEPPLTLEVRAWNLHDALRLAATRPLADWSVEDHRLGDAP